MIDKQIKAWDVVVPIDEIAPNNTRRYQAPIKIRKIEAVDLVTLRAMSNTFTLIGEKTDYVNARRMVNAGDGDSYHPIAEIAELFGAMLLEAKL
jgi:hypothetical protein